ncbi:MAG: TonB-dependent receptor [Algibacter sp.]|uniref:TonB-dependent receptor plug domain-containing protein n=1 Tax=Algibacter sp. TaxID=1872428 RepID=UPI00260A895D|nr:TonB-dependent receptor [Algibacter sp.]MDG1728634.1 TonB-dependent receptor [Algibacter sp.]MDG2179619.1 TonB-dependent receptor [Algibacter sp.]
MKKTHVFGVLCLGFSLVGFAQQQIDSTKVEQLDEVVISDSRFKLKRENSGKTVIKISNQELVQNSGRTLSEIINTKSGITINGAYGQAGSVLSTYVRGGQNRQVLVLIDGIAVNDPSQIENNFDLNLLSLDQIESVEILKGASSALYGNRASTAVINITSKTTSKEKIKAQFSTFLGTNNAQNESNTSVADFTNSIAVNGALKDFNYQVNFSNKFTDGLSSVRATDGEPENDSDEFSKYSGLVKLGYKFSNTFNFSAYANLDNYKTGYDDSFFLNNANFLSRNKQYRFGISSEYMYKNGSVTLNAAINNIEREFESLFPGKFDARSQVIDVFNKYTINDKFYTILGLNYVKSEMNNTDDFTNIEANTANDENIDPYLNVTYLTDFGLNINSGVRLNNHSEYGSHFVYNINPSYSYKIDNNIFKLLSSYSTAFITPSLYQLFVPAYGNTNLKPQEDTTIEAGFEVIILNKKLRFSALYFNREQTNFIDFVTLDFTTFESEYQNVEDTFKVNGVEVELSFTPIKSIVLNANYTFTERQDDVILRVPKQKVNANLGYQLCDKTFMSLDYQYTGKRTAAAFEPDFINRRTLESYSLLNFNMNHKILNNKLQLFAGISNILDEDYEEVYRFSTRGRNYRVGMLLNL